MNATTLDFPWDTRSHSRQATFHHGEYVVTIKVDYDLDHDFSESRGAFDDTWHKDALINPRYRFEDAYKYFLPNITVKERRTFLSWRGFSRGVAEEMARQEAREAMLIAIDGNGLEAFMVRVTVFWRGVEVGESSCSGIELGPDNLSDVFLDGVAQEEVENALAQAETTVRRLRA